MGTQPKSHTRHAGSDTDLEACARLIPLLSALPGRPTRAPTGCQPPPLGRQGQPGTATGRALGERHPPASAGSSPRPTPSTSSPLPMRWGGKGLPVPSLTHGHSPGHSRWSLGSLSCSPSAACPAARLVAAWPAHKAPGSAGIRPVRGCWQRRAAHGALCAGAGMPGCPRLLGDILA